MRGPVAQLATDTPPADEANALLLLAGLLRVVAGAEACRQLSRRQVIHTCPHRRAGTHALRWGHACAWPRACQRGNIESGATRECVGSTGLQYASHVTRLYSGRRVSA